MGWQEEIEDIDFTNQYKEIGIDESLRKRHPITDEQWFEYNTMILADISGKVDGLSLELGDVIDSLHFWDHNKKTLKSKWWHTYTWRERWLEVEQIKFSTLNNQQPTEQDFLDDIEKSKMIVDFLDDAEKYIRELAKLIEENE